MTVAPTGLSMQELAPPPALRGLVTRATAFSERTAAPLERVEAPLLGAVVLLITGPPITVDGRRVRSFAGGLYDRPVVTGHGGEQTGVELTLTPLGARRLLGVPMDELANRVVDLDDLLGRAPETPAGLAAALVARLESAPPVPPEVEHVLARIQAAHGAVRVEALAAEVGWSRRHLAGRFRRDVGLPPKVVARVARVARAVALLRDLPLADVAYVCGYADQAHFTREVKAFTGATPGEFPNVQDGAPAA